MNGAFAQLDQMDDKAREMNMVEALGRLKGTILESLGESFPEADEETCLRAALLLMVEMADAKLMVFLHPEEPSP